MKTINLIFFSFWFTVSAILRCTPRALIEKPLIEQDSKEGFEAFEITKLIFYDKNNVEIKRVYILKKITPDPSDSCKTIVLKGFRI